MMSATPSHCWFRSWVSITRSISTPGADARRTPRREVNRAIAFRCVVDHHQPFRLVASLIASPPPRRRHLASASLNAHAPGNGGTMLRHHTRREGTAWFPRGILFHRRTKPTMSLTAFMVSAAIARARSEPSASTESI